MVEEKNFSTADMQRFCFSVIKAFSNQLSVEISIFDTFLKGLHYERLFLFKTEKEKEFERVKAEDCVSNESWCVLTELMLYFEHA